MRDVVDPRAGACGLRDFTLTDEQRFFLTLVLTSASSWRLNASNILTVSYSLTLTLTPLGVCP
jgi:hypothetical protein